MHYKFESPYMSKLYGISQDPRTKNYIMVLDYAEHGSLRNYLDTNFDKLSMYDKLYNLEYIARGLMKFMKKE